MSKIEKLRKRLLSNPKDFTFTDAEKLMNCFGYSIDEKGKTSGSRVMFCKKGYPPIIMHKPHPRKELLAYQVHQSIDFLQKENLL